MNRLFTTSYQRMNKLFRNVIAFNVSVNISLVIAIKAERVEYLGERDMR